MKRRSKLQYILHVSACSGSPSLCCGGKGDICGFAWAEICVYPSVSVLNLRLAFRLGVEFTATAERDLSLLL